MDNFLSNFFGTIDRFTDWLFRSKKDDCSCGHKAHCKDKCDSCRCEHCNCPKDKKAYKKRLEDLKKRDPFIYK